MTTPHLCILPGDLLGRVTGRAPDHGLACVERWGLRGPKANEQTYGWIPYGVEREERLTVDGVERHRQYAAALAAAAGDEPAIV